MKPLLVVLMIAVLLIVVPATFAKVVVIFDENSATEASKAKFVDGFISHDAGSVVEITTTQKFMGKSSVSCTPSQSYNPKMDGWSFPIDDTPFMSFAWKKDGGTGIMIQMAYDGNWAYRYFSGVNVTNWPGIQLEQEIPQAWEFYTRNLVDDFAAGWNLTGLALTPWDGNAGYYDFIVLHTKEDEWRTAVEPSGKAAVTWGDIKR